MLKMIGRLTGARKSIVMSEFAIRPRTEDEAINAVDYSDAMLSQSLTDLQAFETELDQEIHSKTEALAVVRLAIARMQLVMPSGEGRLDLLEQSNPAASISMQGDGQ